MGTLIRNQDAVKSEKILVRKLVGWRNPRTGVTDTDQRERGLPLHEEDCSFITSGFDSDCDCGVEKVFEEVEKTFYYILSRDGQRKIKVVRCGECGRFVFDNGGDSYCGCLVLNA